MLTLQKKGGKKSAMYPKANPGVLVGIEDIMPAYRVYDLQQGTIKKIPFAQVITHEGHFPFRSRANTSSEKKELPLRFIPNIEAFGDPLEWLKYGFEEQEEKELTALSPSGGGFIHAGATGCVPTTHSVGGETPSEERKTGKIPESMQQPQSQPTNALCEKMGVGVT